MITISGTLSKGWMAKALSVRFDRDYYFDPERHYAIDCSIQRRNFRVCVLSIRNPIWDNSTNGAKT